MNPRECVILLAEDDVNDVLLVQRAFQKSSIANPLQVVRDGEEAVAYLSGNLQYADRDRYPLPVLLLMDLKMPRRSGLEVLVWLRQQPGLKRLPVVVLTSSNQSPDINRAYELGANSYAVKPCTLEGYGKFAEALLAWWMGQNIVPGTEAKTCFSLAQGC